MKALIFILLFLLPVFGFTQQANVHKEEYIEVTTYQVGKKGWVILLDNGQAQVEQPYAASVMQYINSLAKEGWVLVTTFSSGAATGSFYQHYVMKREVK